MNSRDIITNLQNKTKPVGCAKVKEDVSMTDTDFG